MTTEKYGGESVPDASGYTMDPAEVLARAKAFDPTQMSSEQKVRILTIALQCVQRFSRDPWSVRIATYALTECK